MVGLTVKGFYPSGENPWKDTPAHKAFLKRRGKPFKGEWIVVHDAETGELIKIQAKGDEDTHAQEVKPNDAA